MGELGVVLIGVRAAGKTTVGRLLATELVLPFHDSDEEVERRAGRSVAVLLAAGELREREQEVLAELLGGGPAVIATGGGAVLWEGFEAALAGWLVAWLDASTEVLAERIAADPAKRPSLTGGAPEREVEAVVRERAPRYARCARARFDTGVEGPRETVSRIVAFLKGQENASREGGG